MRSDRPQRMRPALRALVCAGALALACPGLAFAEPFKRDRTPLPDGFGDAADAAPSHSGGGSYVRLVVGLAIVVALIYAIYRLLKRANRSGLAGSGNSLAIVATTPLGPSRALHLVRVGPELVLVGSAEQSVTSLRVYDAEEAAELFAELDDAGNGPFTPTGGGRGVAAALDELRRRSARR